jgi:4-hydroxythreonine-4-phosphate dehydrogenase
VELRLAVTPGDPRGVGPEVTLRALEIFGAKHASAAISIVGPEGELRPHDLASLGEEYAKSNFGIDATAGTVAGASIETAVTMALDGRVHAIVTAPLHKPSLDAAGWHVPGQTEMLAELTASSPVGMLMAAESTKFGSPLRVLLATTHLALASVPESVTEDLLVEQTALLHRALRDDWGITSPTIGLCALNPHASDGGLFGSEERSVFEPSVSRLQNDGVDVIGPLPADTVFSRALAGEFDAVVAPYHDVGMAAFKTVSFGGGVNVTIGLPFVRTSPDHGTAFDIAGTGQADPSSMVTALELAFDLANKRFDMDSADV